MRLFTLCTCLSLETTRRYELTSQLPLLTTAATATERITEKKILYQTVEISFYHWIYWVQ